MSQVLASSYHLADKKYCAYVRIGFENHFSEWFDTKDEAMLELRCLEKQLSFELIDTVQGEGYFPERAASIEKLYQESGRTSGLYTGLAVVQ